MNTNLAHNIINLAMVAAAAALAASGCTADAAGALECSKSWIDPEITGYALAAMGAVKIGMNLWRDGLSGLFKKQPPVVK